MTLDRMTSQDANHGTHDLEMICMIETLHGGMWDVTVGV